MNRLAEKEFRKLHFFPAVIPEKITLSEAPMTAKPIALHGAGASGAEAFRELAKKMLVRLE